MGKQKTNIVAPTPACPACPARPHTSRCALGLETAGTRSGEAIALRVAPERMVRMAQLSATLCDKQGLSLLLQLRVLCLGLLQDGDVRVSIFPEGEEIFICCLGFGGVALQGVGATDLEMRECSDG